MNKSEINQLEQCLGWMEAGASDEEIVQKIPAMTEEMRDILQMAREMMAIGESPTSIEKMALSRTRLLQQAAVYREQDERMAQAGLSSIGWRLKRLVQGLGNVKPMVSGLGLVVCIALLLIISSGGLVIASAKSLPGDSLYPVKLAVEDIRVYFVPNQEIRQEYEENYLLQRVDEVKSLLRLKRIQHISFEGTLENISGNHWLVSGIDVTIQDNTTIVGGSGGQSEFVPGSMVEVEGATNVQGGVTANEIHLRRYLYQGIVEKIDPNAWQVSGISFIVNPQTAIEQGIGVGDRVVVMMRSDDTGLYAMTIRKAELATETPTQEPTAGHEADSDEHEPALHEHLGTRTPESMDDVYEGVEDLQETTEATQEVHDEHLTSEPTEQHDLEETSIPEHHETPEPTAEHEETP